MARTGRDRFSGVLLVELLYVLLLWAVAIAAFVSLSSAQLGRRRAASAARLAAFLASSAAVAPEVVHRETAGLIASWSRSEDWSWRVERFLGSPAARFYRLTAAVVQRLPSEAGAAETVVVAEAQP